MLNHYCFAGRQSFGSDFRVLVAGGGTGDATIYLAEQLKDSGAQVVHLDMSHASMEIARERAPVRGLTNIAWIEDSLLNLPEMALEPFDSWCWAPSRRTSWQRCASYPDAGNMRSPNCWAAASRCMCCTPRRGRIAPRPMETRTPFRASFTN